MQSSGNSANASEADNPTEWDGNDRRSSDRRDAPTRPWTNWLTPLRREHGRRDADHSSYVDRYTKRDVALLLSIFLLNVGDAFFTMLWLGRGGKEANPVMDFFLDIGPAAFLVQKCLVVGFWLLLLVVHKNFRFARIGLYATLVVYALLMLIHFSIVALDIEPPPQDEAASAGVIRIEPLADISPMHSGSTISDRAADESAQMIVRRVARPASE